MEKEFWTLSGEDVTRDLKDAANACFQNN